MNIHIDKKQMLKRLNRVAKTYDEFATIHRKMAYQVLWQLKNCAWHGRRILEVGCGTGYLTQLLLDYYPEVNITAVDLAHNMIQSAYEKVTPISRVHFVVGDVEDQEWKANSFDLIISNAAIHWLQYPEETVQKWVRSLRPHGYLIVSTFGPNTLQELAYIFHQVELQMGLVPEIHTLPLRPVEVWENIFYQAGCGQVESEENWFRQKYANCRQLLYTIKATGESYNNTRRNIITSSRILEHVMQKYGQAFRWKEQVYVTYHLMYIVARKLGEHLESTKMMDG
ncbi:malonyl-ACP O-methyltransferase BioC [Thermoflavimicrobium daqui]|uniref:Malonyl-[acyl-carrier protein] O-methyltransferase n=1 Tax=Thermoflavimicrobium daqui TaxID=2137476 RepID=A0A364K518_9BACL|nr:malonyl-ACP O-methyltransferase BioC [Thermoflavimicrobium daqui]RAL24381.1 malonyl-[acyl-carrier protein] O-methyltransferase BioC [Thermoflavimicrobium daqui]